MNDLASRQHGVVSAVQACALGMGRDAVWRRARSGRWLELLPGVFRVGGAPSSPKQRLMAATLWAGRGAVISHTTAGWLWCLDAIGRDGIHLWVPGRRSPRSAAVTVHRATTLDPVDVADVDGIPVTTAARTIIDLAGVLDDEALETAVESAFHRGLVRDSFLRWRLSQLGGKGRAGAGRLARLLDDRGTAASALESPLEVKAWRLLIRSGLPRPVRQHWVRVGGRRYRIDFAWPDRSVGLECDGYEKHGGRLAFRRDRRKLAALASAHWLIVPVTWDDVVKTPGGVLDDVRAALRSAA